MRRVSKEVRSLRSKLAVAKREAEHNLETWSREREARMDLKSQVRNVSQIATDAIGVVRSYRHLDHFAIYTADGLSLALDRVDVVDQAMTVNEEKRD